MEVIVFLVLVAILAALAARFLLSVVTVRDYQRGLHYRGGKLVGLLSTGTHYAIKPMSEIQVLDVRPALAHRSGPGDPDRRRRRPEGQPDGALRRRPTRSRRSRTTRAGSPRSTPRSTRACATRSPAGPRTTCSRSGARSGRRSPPRSRATSPGSGSSCSNVDVRDVMVPAELKRAYAGIVAARREGEAALERARGETAALRALANAGRLLEDNPGLLQLRVLQQLGASSGNTIMLGIGGPDGAAADAAAARCAAGSRRPRAVVGPARARPDHGATADLSPGRVGMIGS